MLAVVVHLCGYRTIMVYFTIGCSRCFIHVIMLVANSSGYCSQTVCAWHCVEALLCLSLCSLCLVCTHCDWKWLTGWVVTGERGSSTSQYTRPVTSTHHRYPSFCPPLTKWYVRVHEYLWVLLMFLCSMCCLCASHVIITCALCMITMN